MLGISIWTLDEKYIMTYGPLRRYRTLVNPCRTVRLSPLKPCTCRIITTLFLQLLSLGTLAELDEKILGSALTAGDGSHRTQLRSVMTWGGWKLLGNAYASEKSRQRPPKTT